MRFFVLVIQLARDGIDKGEARGQFVGREMSGQQFGPGLFESDFSGREMGAASQAFETLHELPIAGVTGDKFHSIHCGFSLRCCHVWRRICNTVLMDSSARSVLSHC